MVVLIEGVYAEYQLFHCKTIQAKSIESGVEFPESFGDSSDHFQATQCPVIGTVKKILHIFDIVCHCA